MDEKIYVTKSFLPDKSKYFSYLENIFDNNLPLTNNANLVTQLEHTLINFLHVPNLLYVTNGTIAIQLAINALGLENCEIITTPFTYVATINSILWEKCTPVFVDIEPNTFTIDADKIEEKITPKTKAIIAVHVFGFACDIEKIQAIAEKYNLKVIYDGAHAFASKYNEKSLLSFGDITTCSFHATKLFHTVEGGAIITNSKELYDKCRLLRQFGHVNDTYYCVGINAKQSEFHAAMGLCNIEYLPEIITKRRDITKLYKAELQNIVEIPKEPEKLRHNHGYFPVLFKNETELLHIFKVLAKENIFPRRYFYPSLNTLPFLAYQSCPISENIASRIACLPLYPQLAHEDVYRICALIKKELAS